MPRTRVSFAALAALALGLAACGGGTSSTSSPTSGSAGSSTSSSRPPSTATVDYIHPSTPRDVASGSFLGVVGGTRFLRVADPQGAAGCEGAPTPDLRALPADGDAADATDPAHQIRLSAGGNALFGRADDRLALVAFCEGFVEHAWFATVYGTQLTDVTDLPALQPAPTATFVVTAWSHDRTRLLGVETTAAGLDGHRALAVDTTSGAVSDLGIDAYWVGDLADGTLVADRGDHVRIGDVSVPLSGVEPGLDSRFLAVSPDGEEVAVGSPAGLLVVERDGQVAPLIDDPVAGIPAWSPDGRALAYPTGSVNQPAGELRVVARNGGEPVPVDDDVVVWTPAAFARQPTGSDVDLLYSTATAAPADPHLAQVTFSPGGGPGSTPSRPTASTSSTTAS